MTTDTNTEQPRKVLLIGMDGLMPEQIDRYKDDVPELRAFLERGFFSPAHSSPYTCTATNWPTIATGAWVGTHGCTSFNVHLPGMELGETTPSFNSHLCQAEYFWHAAERQGKRCILINYPCAFPKVLTNGVVVGGDGLQSQAWTVRYPDRLHTHNDSDSGANRIVVRKPGTWQNLPADITPVSEGIVALAHGARFAWDAAGIRACDDASLALGDDSEPRYLLVYRRAGELALLMAANRDAANPIAVLRLGAWSGWVHEHFGGRDCLRQYKLTELSEDGGRIGLYGTMAGATEGWGVPAGLESEIIEKAGGYVEALELEGCYDLRSGNGQELCLEIMDIQARWTSDCAAHLNATQDWDAMWIQYHAPDGVSHALLGYLESEDEKLRTQADDMLRETVRTLFQMVDRVVRECADEDTVVCLVSDHGNLPKERVDLPDVMLHQKGWLVLEGFDQHQRPIVDSKRSMARAGAHGVWLNVRGREMYGCIEPGEEYETLRTEIIEALLAMRDAETGECPFALVGRREDFAGMGMHGERVEDIVFFPKDRNFHMSDMNLFYTHRDFYENGVTSISLDEAIKYGLVWDLTAVHWGLPEATVGYASNRPIFMLAGPGVKQGARGDRRVNLVDVSPTLAHVLGIDPPAQAEGRIVGEAFSRKREATRTASPKAATTRHLDPQPPEKAS